MWKTQVLHLVHQFVGEDSLKCRAVVLKKHPKAVPPLLHVGQCSMEGCGYGVLCKPVSSVRKLVGVKAWWVKRCDVTPAQFSSSPVLMRLTGSH